MSKLIELDDFDTFPKKVLQFLYNNKNDLYDERQRELKDLHERSYKSKSDYPYINNLEDIVSQTFTDKRLKAYHFTKAPQKGYYKKSGLKVLEKDAHLQYFLSVLSKEKVDKEIIREIKKLLSVKFESIWADGRDQKIYFTLFKGEKYGDGLFYFLEHFGGEIISMLLEENDQYEFIIKSIGIPTVVIFEYPYKKLNLCGSKRFAEHFRDTFLNKYVDRSISIQFDEDYSTENISPDKILEELTYPEYESKYLN
ncbi:MAG TPA: hypothetical protein DCL80_03885 [Balneola sp.]|jgi:hypothetical protein|nr:hypothetical protein [Balneola sp.]MAO77331.1 hypothetical protein [Balneola sp.]HAH50434.1 hypothetical protein [Balneola sp.]HBZ39572.1 hypothetical protein [Balneola sp.]|tara:strand:+ start:4404 stop:5165 length:762 start_codon:yes stop_codon:yes gene_type:complete